MREKIYPLRGGESGPKVAGYDSQYFFICWDQMAEFDNLRHYSLEKKSKSFLHCELSSVTTLVYNKEEALIELKYSGAKGGKKIHYIPFEYIEDAEEFVEAFTKQVSLNTVTETMNGKIDHSKEVLGIVGTVTFGGFFVYLAWPGNGLKPTKRLVKLAMDVAEMLTIYGVLGIMAVSIGYSLFKINKKKKSKKKVYEYTR